MLPAWTVDDIREDLEERYCSNYPTKWPGIFSIPLGILLARPDQELSRKEIIPSLDYFHHRSGENINFYCAGYGRFWRDDGELHTDRVPVAHIEGSSWPWEFSPKAFADFVDEVERITTWKYSGGVELLLLNASNEESGYYFELDYSRVINIDIVKAKKAGAIEDVHHLFEDIFRIAHDRCAGLHVDTISDELGGKSTVDAARDILIDLVPRGIGKRVWGAVYFAVHNLKPRR